MFPRLAQVSAHLRRTYDAFELAEANLHHCESKVNNATYYRLRRELVKAISEEGVFDESALKRYLQKAGLWQRVRTFGVYLQREPVQGTSLYLLHIFFDGRDGPMDEGHGHTVLIVDESGEPVRVKWHRPADCDVIC